MKYLLDTDICIYIIKKNPASVIKKFSTLKLGDVGISSVTLAELMYGVEKSQYKAKNRSALDEFISPLEILSFDDDAAVTYGVVRSDLEARGKLIGPLDMMIAAHAKALGVILVTNNKQEFARVSHLKTENWVK